MKKLMMVLVLVVTTSVMAVAQPIKFGVKAGLNFDASTLSLPKGNSSSTVGQQLMDTYKTNTGFHAGITMRINLLGLYVQGDALYVTESYKYGEGTDMFDVKESALDIPVVVGFKFLFFRVYAGPRFNINLSNNVKFGSVDDAKAAWENRTLGYQAGIGLDLGKLAIDASFNGGFSKDTQDLSELGFNDLIFEKSNSTVRLSLSYFF